MVKTAFCSCREPTLRSQHPQVSSQPSITLVAGDLIPFLTFVGLYMQVTYKYTLRHIHIYTNNKYFLKKQWSGLYSKILLSQKQQKFMGYFVIYLAKHVGYVFFSYLHSPAMALFLSM